jgi:uncharacterized protein (TIGR02594 family)
MATGFAVTISARDDISKSLAKINSGLQQLGQVARGVNAEAAKGADKGGTSFRKMGEHATEAGKGIVDIFSRVERQTLSTTRRLGEMLTPLRALTAAASLGGLAALVDNWAHLSANIGRTAISVGTTTRELQRMQGAGQYAGIATDTMSQSLGSLNRRIHDAAYGLGGSQGMLFYAAKFGIALRNTDGSVRSTTAVMHDLADAGARLKDPDSQHRLFEAFGVDELFSLLRQGGAAMDKFADKTIVQSDEEIAKGREVEESYIKLGQAGAAAGNLIAVHLAPHVKRLADWMAQPANRAWLGAELERFFKAVENFDFSKLVPIIDGLGVLAKALASLGAPGSLGWGAMIGGVLGWKLGGARGAAAGAAVGGAAGAVLGGPENPGRSPGKFGSKWLDLGYLGHLLFGGASAPGDPRGKEAVIRAAATKYGHDPDTAVKVSRGEGLGSYTGDNGTSFGAFHMHTGGGLGDEFKKETGLDPSDPKNEDAMIDWSMKNLSRTGWGPYHGAAAQGVGSRTGIGSGTQKPWYQRILGGLNPVSTAAAASADEMLGMRGLNRGRDRGTLNSYLRSAGHNLDVGVSAWCAAYVNATLKRQGIAGSGSDIATSFGRWGQGVAAGNVQKGDVLVKMRGHRVGETGGHVGEATGRVDSRGRIEMIQGNRGGAVATSWENPSELTMRRAIGAGPEMPMATDGGGGAGDSSHSVEVKFLNTPPGVSTGLTNASGNASFSLRTERALATP